MPTLDIRDPQDVVPADVPTDAELLARWSIAADRGALGALIRRHGGMVLGVCRRALGNSPDADDAFQATFLVFVRKAGSLAYPEQVAAWLHGVALRVAHKARAVRCRRHEREVAIVDPAAPDPPEDTSDLRRVLDEELDRLPEKYRLPIVLCELEGRTLEEAAGLLGWPKGTVAGRLSRGRELLRGRLSRRRGLVLPLFLIGGVGTGIDAPAPPAPLVLATLASAAGGAETASRPAALADATLKSRGRRLGLLAILLLGTGLLAAATWGARAAIAAYPGPHNLQPPATNPGPSDTDPPAQPRACHQSVS
jgi:RNA polymerase sigma factor (sigma-70 family)